jgi:hypothetical protein
MSSIEVIPTFRLTFQSASSWWMKREEEDAAKYRYKER